MTSWQAPRAYGPVRARVALPGSKSLTNRLLLLAALGVSITDYGDDVLVRPARLHGAKIDCGLAGTVMRFVPPVAALADGDSFFDGDAHARTRPMRALLDALRRLGVRIDGADSLPFRLHGTGSVDGGAVEIDASASSQFVSGLLLAGARFAHGLELRHVGEPVPSLPHIEMTVELLRGRGVLVDDSLPNRWLVAPGPIRAADAVVEPDLSNAAPFLAAALVTGGSVHVPRWPAATTQPGDLLRDLLAEMGAVVELDADGLTVKGGTALGPLVADLHEVGELTPVLAAVCALADGESMLTGIAHLRGHETDRLAALQAELTGLGGDVQQTDDGLQIRPAPLHGGLWHAYADHRMATAGAVVGLAVDGVQVDDIACTTKTLPDFAGMWSAMLDA